jgi:hypothetical protein
MERNEIEQLAQFNSERARGLVHTEEYSERMGRLQQQFDEEARISLAKKGVITVGKPRR